MNDPKKQQDNSNQPGQRNQQNQDPKRRQNELIEPQDDRSQTQRHNEPEKQPTR
jgi:hypothetical protein